MRFRVLALALLVYVGIDFSDPSVPGVFFFDADQLFVDSVVPAKGNGLSAKPHVDPSRHPTLFDARWPTSPGPILRDVTVARRPPCYTREPRSTLRLAPDPSSDIGPLASAASSFIDAGAMAGDPLVPRACAGRPILGGTVTMTTRGLDMAEATGTLKTTAAALRKAVPDLMEVATIPDGQVCRLACTVSYSGDDPTNARGQIVVTRIEAVAIGSGKFRFVRSGLVGLISATSVLGWIDY